MTLQDSFLGVGVSSVYSCQRHTFVPYIVLDQVHLSTQVNVPKHGGVNRKYLESTQRDQG